MTCEKTPSVDFDAVTGVVRLELSAQTILELEVGVIAADVQVQVPVPRPKARMVSWHRQEFGDHVIDIQVRQIDRD